MTATREDGTPMRHIIETREGWFEQYLPAPEACKRMKALRRNRQTKKARQIYLSVEQRGHTSETTYFPLLGNVPVSLPVATKFITDAHRNFVERGAHVKLTWCDSCLFIG